MNATAHISRETTARAGEASTTRVERRIRTAQIEVMFQTAPASVRIGFGASIFLAVVMVVNYGYSVVTAEIWISLHFVHFVFREAVTFLYWRRAREAGNEGLYATSFSIGCVATGLAWSLGTQLVLMPSGLEQETIIALCLLALGSGGVLSLYSHLPAVVAHLLSLTLPLVFFALQRDDTFHTTLAVLALFYIVAMLLLAWRSNLALTRSLRLDIEKRDLIRDLSEQKELAVEANQSKSRFLAAASHDLRQPVHALSMFVGALRERRLDAGSDRLVEQISGSIETLDTLFGSLLDISRLDAGVVPHREEGFALYPLMERVCGDFTLEAERKKLVLTLLRTNLAVMTDSVLLETILRNVISNAVRYTDRGRILVGCRRTRDGVRIEVIDTGRGIARRDLERIFEEFYQVGNPERDRAKGLGLGLAIVKRIAALIRCEVDISSKLGHGTRVSVRVPRIAALPATTPVVRAAAEPMPKPGVIFVIDDELSIRRAMGALLMSWGHRVIVAGSGPEILAVAAESPLRPDLVISDLRLRERENGIQLMDRLRYEYNDDIPGILMTGDTAPERLTEARESGYLILHKPVSSAKLRAAMTTLLAQRTSVAVIEPESAP